MVDPRICHVPKDHNVIIYKKLTFCKFFFLALTLAVSLMCFFNACIMYFWQPVFRKAEEFFENDFFVKVFLSVSAVSFLFALILLFCVASPRFGREEKLKPFLLLVIKSFLDDYPHYRPSSRSSRTDEVVRAKTGGLPSYSDVVLLPSHSETA